MDIINTPPYEELQRIYSRYFSLGYLNCDINSKFALISLTCYLKHKLSQKKPDVTHYQIIKKIIGNEIPEDFIKGVSVICSDFEYGCTEFPTFGLENKQIPEKIKEILRNWIPF